MFEVSRNMFLQNDIMFMLFAIPVEKSEPRYIHSSFFVNKMLNSDRISDTAHGERSSIKRTKTFLFSPAMAACFDIRYVCTVSAKAFESRPSTEQHFYAKLVGATDKNWQNSKNSWQSATGPLLYPSAVNFKLSLDHSFFPLQWQNKRTTVPAIMHAPFAIVHLLNTTCETRKPRKLYDFICYSMHKETVYRCELFIETYIRNARNVLLHMYVI